MTFVVVFRLFKLVLVFSCSSLKFGSLGISLSVGIGSVERILLLMSTYVRAYSFSSAVDLYDKRARYGSVKFPYSPTLHYAFSSWIEKTTTKTIHCHWENRFVLQ